MHLIRRAALRAASNSLKPRSITTSTPFVLRPKTSNVITPAVIRRFASDDAAQSYSESVEQSSVQSTIGSADEPTSSYQSEVGTGTIESAVEAASGAAVGAASGNTFGDSGFDLTPTNGVYVGNLLFDVTADDLTREFQSFGKIEKATVAQDARGLSKGFGYVEFESVDSATAAIKAKHQTTMEGRRIVVNYIARTTREKVVNPPSKTLFVGNLAFEMTDADLNKMFRDIRNVIDVRVAIDRRTGQPRGFAHADFVDVESAVKAMEALKGKEIYNRVLRLDYSTSAGGSGDRRPTGGSRGGRGGFGGNRGGDRGGDRGGYGGNRGGRDGADRGGDRY